MHTNQLCVLYLQVRRMLYGRHGFHLYIPVPHPQNIKNKIKKQPMIEWIKKATSKNITGNYKFHIKSQPQILDTATTISVTPFTDKSESAIVPCHYKWYRVRNGISEESYKFRGNSYVCDSSDIGAVIQAQVTSNDPQYSGQANVQFGPIKLSVEIKKHLMDTLANGSTFIRGMVCLSEYQEKQCQFKIFQDMIKICHLQSELNFSFPYSTFDPRFEPNSKDPTRISIIFPQNDINLQAFMRNLFGPGFEQQNSGNECRIQTRFSNRQVKDIFLLTLKAFFTKKQLKNSVVVHKIEQSSFNQHQDINLLFEVESLRSDVSRLYTSNENKQKEKLRLTQQVHRLEHDIEEIVTTYTRIAQEKVRNMKDLNESYAVLNNKKDDVFGRKCQTLEKQNLNLNQRIKLLTAEIDDIRLNTSAARKNQTINNNNNLNPNFTHVTTIRQNSQMPRNQVTSFENILEHLSQSRVTDFNETSFKMTKQLERANDQKAQLEKKLEKSFRVIDDLEKKLKNQSQHNYSAVVNFQRKDFQPQINTSTYSLAVDLDKIQLENNRLKGMNEALKKQNVHLQNQLKSNASKIIIKPSAPSPIQNMKVSVSSNNSSAMLQMENDALKKQIGALKMTLQNEQQKCDKYLKDKIVLERKVQQLMGEVSMFRKNQQVLNRSQHLSMEMDSYNQEKMQALQSNNQFLIAENEKLSKALQKYMAQARQTIQLRKQLLNLKSQNSKNTPNPLNPQKQSKSISILSKSILNSSQYSEVIK